jgi:hypothetical protein
MRAESARWMAKALGVDVSRWSRLEKTSLENFAVTLGMIPDLASWKGAEKVAMVGIIRAKAARDEMRHLHLMQRLPRLREALLRLGSSRR